VSKIRQHVLGKRILGTIGYRSTNHITFDIDYHGQDSRRELFLARCQAFHQELTQFFSTAWFATCKPNDIGGIHFTVLVETMPIERAQRAAQRFLALLDQKYPALAAIESFTKLEVYPVAKGEGNGLGCRLPLSQGRVCFTDRLLADNPRSNCVNLVQWICDHNRKNVEKSVFLEFLAKNTPEHAALEPVPSKPAKRKKTNSTGMGSIGKLKGRCLRTVFDFWSGKAVPENDTIGKYAVVTARLIWKQGILDEEQCGDWLEGAFLELPHQAFSDRLSHDFAELMRSTRKMVEAVYLKNGYQTAPEESNQKLASVMSYCLKHGIVIHDRSTWPRLPDKAQWLADFGTSEVEQFTYDQRRILKEQVHALLHTGETADTYEAARRVVAFVKQNPGRELAWKLVPLLCGDLAIRWHKNKCCAFLAALVRVGFLYVTVEKMWRGPLKAMNRARSYGIGAALVERRAGRSNIYSSSPSFSYVSTISHSDWIRETARPLPRTGYQRLKGLSGSRDGSPQAFVVGENGGDNDKGARGPPNRPP
jgi:hypothetical protein